MQRIFHIVTESDWRAACDTGFYVPDSLATQGFVHFSHADQVAGTANRFYAEDHGLIVIEVDPALLSDPVVEEDLYGAGEEFPHVYGEIPTAAAIAEHALTRDAEGHWQFST